MFAVVRRGCRRHRSTVTLVASLAATIALALLLVGKWDELETGVTGAPLAIVAAAVCLQVVALVSRSEAWHVCVRACGGSVTRRALYRASSMGFVGGLVHTQLGTAARIAALRRSAPEESPRVPALIGAELPILIVEGGLAALTSFTLIGPLGLPWWVPLLCLTAVAATSAALRSVATAGARWLRSGLSVMRTLDGRARLAGFVLIAVLAQVARNWLLLHAVGVDASLFDAIAVLIAVVSLGQLPFGLSVGAAASVLILGPQGVAAAAAAGVLLTATGTVGGLFFAAWGALDFALSAQRVRALARRVPSGLANLGVPWSPWISLGALGAQVRRAVERSCFDILGHVQARPLLATASGAGLAPAVALAERRSDAGQFTSTAVLTHSGRPAPLPAGRQPPERSIDRHSAGAPDSSAERAGNPELDRSPMATTKLLLATGDQLEVDASLDEVVKELENAARSSAGTLARLTQAKTGESVAVNVALVVSVRPGA